MANSVRATLVEVANLLADLIENQNVESTPTVKRRSAPRPVPPPQGPFSEVERAKAREILRNKRMKTS